MGDKGKGRGQKGAPHGPRQIDPCWVCGGPHLQRDCPDAKGKGKGNLIPVPAAWNSWRPTTFTAPSPQQWRQWMPKGKGKGQKRKGKGKINELAQWAYGQPLGQIQYGDWVERRRGRRGTSRPQARVMTQQSGQQVQYERLQERE